MVVLSAISAFSGCSDKKNLEIKPYPKYLGMSNKIIYDNKSFWNVDLKEDMDDYSIFLKKTFDDIEAYNKRWAERYGVQPQHSEQNDISHNTQRDVEFDYGGIIDEQYN